MSTISIIGSGNMATAIGSRAAKHGHTVEIMSRNAANAQAAADQIGHGATVGTFGERPAGDIVFLAVLYAGAVDVVEHYGDALAGKILVEITNPFNADASGVVDDPRQLGDPADRRRCSGQHPRREGVQHDLPRCTR